MGGSRWSPEVACLTHSKGGKRDWRLGNDSSRSLTYLLQFFYLSKEKKRICVLASTSLSTSTSSPFHRPQQLFPNLYTPSLPPPERTLILAPSRTARCEEIPADQLLHRTQWRPF